MNKDSVKVVAMIGAIVRESWPGAQKSARLPLIKHALRDIDDQFIELVMDLDKHRLQITTDLPRSELIIITIDGNMGLYYVNSTEGRVNQGEHDMREPIRIELLETRTVQIVKTYQVQVPVTGSESLEELLSLSNDYSATLTDIKLEEIDNVTSE